MNKTFFALIAVLPFISGCWPFSSKEETKHEMVEMVTPTEESNQPESSMSEESTQSEAETAAESDEK